LNGPVILFQSHSYRKGGRDAIELDVDYDKRVPREVLIAGDDAKIADIVKAKEILGQCDGDFNAASRNYQKIHYRGEGYIIQKYGHFAVLKLLYDFFCPFSKKPRKWALFLKLANARS
jgi:hypothetical protein